VLKRIVSSFSPPLYSAISPLTGFFFFAFIPHLFIYFQFSPLTKSFRPTLGSNFSLFTYVCFILQVRALVFYQYVPLYLLNLMRLFLGVYKKNTYKCMPFFFCLFLGVKIFFYYILRNKKRNKTIGK